MGPACSRDKRFCVPGRAGCPTLAIPFELCKGFSPLVTHLRSPGPERPQDSGRAAQPGLTAKVILQPGVLGGFAQRVRLCFASVVIPLLWGSRSLQVLSVDYRSRLRTVRDYSETALSPRSPGPNRSRSFAVPSTPQSPGQSLCRDSGLSSLLLPSAGVR